MRANKLMEADCTLWSQNDTSTSQYESEHISIQTQGP